MAQCLSAKHGQQYILHHNRAGIVPYRTYSRELMAVQDRAKSIITARGFAAATEILRALRHTLSPLQVSKFKFGACLIP